MESRQNDEDDDESVRHLVALGYVDPDEIAARHAALRRQREAELRRAMDLNVQGRSDDSVVLLEKLSSDHPNWTPPRQLLAEIHYRAARWNEAQSHLDWLAHHGVEQPRLALIAGGVALARRQLRAALEYLRYVTCVEPNLADSHVMLGTVLHRLGRSDAAADAFQQALQRNPADARACDGMAAVHLKRGRHEDAADWALRALEQDMRLASAHYHLGVALAHMDRPEEALSALESCVRLDPARAAPFYWLSRIAKNQLADHKHSAEYRQRGRQIIRQRRERS